jgi:hypothetical protein
MHTMRTAWVAVMIVTGLAAGADSTVAAEPGTFERIGGKRTGRVRAALDSLGITVSWERVVAVGFDRTDGDVVVVTLDRDGYPSRRDIEVPEGFRSRIMERAATAAAQESPPGPAEAPERQQGRVYFMVNATLRSTSIYPTALSLALPRADSRVVTGMALMSFGGSLFGSYALTKGMELGYGRVAMMNYGGEVGVYYPLLTAFIVADRGSTRAARRLGAWGAMAGFPLGTYLGTKVDFAGNHEYGNAALMRHFGRVGLAYGFALPLLWAEQTGFDAYRTTSSSLAMALLPAGFYLGYRLGEQKSWSSGRSGLVVIAGIMGAATGVAITSLSETDEVAAYAALGMLGGAAGTVAGFRIYPGRPYSFGQGVFMGVSAAVSAGVGLGIPFIFQAEHHQAYTVPAVLGAWGGLFLGERLGRALFEDTPRDGRTGASARFPILTQWPLAAAGFMAARRSNDPAVRVSAELVRWRF